MDFDLSAHQRAAMDALAAIVADCPGDRLGGVLADECNPELERRLCEAALLSAGADMLDRVVLVEEASRLGAPVNATATLLIRPLLGSPVASGPLAIRTADDGVPLRYGHDAIAVVDVSEEPPTVAETESALFHSIPSGTVAGYGIVAALRAAEVPWESPLSPLATYQLGRAAEIAGAARRAVELTASYLRTRRQFGRTLSSFQALQHRLAQLAVDAEATSTLVRMAAHTASEASVLGAASYAVGVAARAVPELHQLTGAHGFTFESGLPAYTLRLVASRVELIGTGVSPVMYADAVWT